MAIGVQTSAMKWIKRFLKFVVAPILLVVLVVVAYIAKTHHPSLDGIITHPSLKAEVHVVRDDWAVPHIVAENEPDAYFALGYVMAQDRLFQMEVWRRLARGELSEIVGPLAVPIDKIARSFRLRAHAEEFVASKIGAYPEMKAAAEAFVAGINHCMATEPLPFEFVALRIPARPFTVVDSIAVAAILPITFAEGLEEDVLCSMLKEKSPAMDVDALFPGYGNETPVTVMESPDEAAAYRTQHPPAASASSRDTRQTLDSLGAFHAQLQAMSRLLGHTLGSNSWVLGPSRTQSGKPILANDPHIAFTNPSIWYEAHLQYGDFENYGFHLPLIPFPLLGHNRDRAWAITMFCNDDTDLYRETFQPGDPNKVLYKGAWVDVRTETETIKVRFGRDVPYTVRITPHGPVITDLFRTLDGYQGADVSMFWVWQHAEYTDFRAFYGMAHARDADAFGRAVSLVTSPGLNISYADRQGNIAWWAAGLIPIRPKHVNPKQLLDGASGNDELLGYVPFEQNPQMRNPASGCIVTANNLSTVKPVGVIDALPGYWEPTDRAGRIQQMLGQREKWTLEELKAVQFDDASYSAPGIVKQVLEVLGNSQTFTPLERKALETLAAWDCRHGVDSCGATIFQNLCDTLLQNALEDEMGRDLCASYCSLADHWSFFKAFIGDDASPYWDDVTTPPKETRRDIVVKSFKDTVVRLRKELGPDLAKWTWGRVHTMEFKHPFGYLPLLGRIFNVGPFPSSGASDVVNCMLSESGLHDYRVIAGPSTRRLIDFVDPEHSLAILPTGNSGNFMSPSYGDQAPLFMGGQYREPRFTDDQVRAHTTHELVLRPN